ncbi:MAG: hypothetical protein J3K34DRAFT_457009 [Monoraphidium minutum]|nr:MAG: hypothetical protein J3K34DRAFT_457009 [Monoraphidium minutum]
MMRSPRPETARCAAARGRGARSPLWWAADTPARAEGGGRVGLGLCAGLSLCELARGTISLGPGGMGGTTAPPARERGRRPRLASTGRAKESPFCPAPSTFPDSPYLSLLGPCPAFLLTSARVSCRQHSSITAALVRPKCAAAAVPGVPAPPPQTHRSNIQKVGQRQADGCGHVVQGSPPALRSRAGSDEQAVATCRLRRR